MSMTKQLWSAIIVSMLLALCGSLFASLLSARGYLNEQLTMKNNDNANALALSLSQGEVDAVRIELATAALFDNGQYQLIRVTDPRGKIIVEKTANAEVPDAPKWFVSLLPIDVEPGTAQISNGWKQFGTITLQSETRFAYRSLWKSALQMVGTLALSSLIAGYLGSIILRRLIPPLREVVKQAQGITQRRFSIIAVPKVPELAKLAEAMNLMVSRLQSMFDQEAERLEAVRREANYDALTGLANRGFFMARLTQSIADSSSGGLLVMLRIAGLADINQQLGRQSTDELLKAVGARIAATAKEEGFTVIGRMGGSDFSLLAIGKTDDSISEALLAAVMTEAPRFALDPEHFVHVGSVLFQQGVEVGLVLSQVDAALASAESNGRSAAVSKALDAILAGHPRNTGEWEMTLRNALLTKQVRLEKYPIVNAQGQVVAHECPLRLRFDENSAWLPAAQFVPLAERLRMTAELDLAALELGIAMIEKDMGNNVLVLSPSPQSIADPDFRRALSAMLGKHRKAAALLWLEIAESGALLHLDAVTQLCTDMAPLGCRVGIEHFGHEFSQIGRLHQIGLHYLKIDSSFVRDIDNNVGNQAFLQGVRSITHTTGLQLQAEGVTTDAEFKKLAELGFDAVTGPGVRAA